METNCISTTENNSADLINTVSWHDLYAFKFDQNDNFQLSLSDGSIFISNRVVRLIPKRRLVAFGNWSGKPVVAKLFFDPRRANQHIEKDLSGIKKLQKNRIPTPALYYQGMSEDRRVHILIFERLAHVQNLEEIWQQKSAIDDVFLLLQAMIKEIATQHVLGIVQKDLHMNNFLVGENIIYTLDGAEIEIFPHLLPKKMSMNNLALFLSQLGIGIEKQQEALFRYYAKLRGWLLKKEDVIDLFFLIKKWNLFRWQRFEKKIFRESTNFSRLSDWRSLCLFDRNYLSNEFLNFLHNPESLFTHPSAKILKAGRSATVVKVTLGNQPFVVKRYNLKNFWHRMRRLFRPTRAYTSWRLAQKLNLFGVATAKPVAFIEKRFLCLRSQSYYITEYIPGEHASDFFNHLLFQEEKMNQMVHRIVLLLKNIAKLEITHGDLKASNILINKCEQPFMIDLDGAREHASLSSLKSSWRKEIKRFLQNFYHQPQVLEKFKMEFRKKS